VIPPLARYTHIEIISCAATATMLLDTYVGNRAGEKNHWRPESASATTRR